MINEKYAREIEEFKSFEKNSTLLVILDCIYGEYRHYIAISKKDNQPYEVYAKVIAMEGPSFASSPVEVFDMDTESALKKITYSDLICLLEKQVSGISKHYKDINENSWESYIDVKSIFYNEKNKNKCQESEQ